MNISVIIPVYNREKTIYKCIDSVLKQTYQPVEIIIVDDCSTDNSINIINELKSDLIKIIRCEKNCGAQHARNMGIKEAKGEWIAFHDSDDVWYADKLEKQVKALEETKYKVCSGGALVKKNDIEYEWFCKGKSGDVFDEVMTFTDYVFFPALLVKKECLEKIGYLDENVLAYQELDTAIRLLKNEKMVYVCEPLFIYNLMENNSISKNNMKGIEGRKYLYTKYRSIIENEVSYRIAWYKAFAGDYGWKRGQFYIYCVKWVFWNIVSLGRRIIGKES